MGLQYKNLDEETRALMVEEVERDVGDGSLYLSNYLNEHGCANWPTLLGEAARMGDDDSLADALRLAGCLRDRVPRNKPKSGITMASVPVTAAQTMAEGQFNMYYMRALARRAIDTGQRLVVYRAKAVGTPRRESEEMIGQELDPSVVLQALRETKGVNPPIGVPLPNSGLSVQLV